VAFLDGETIIKGGVLYDGNVRQVRTRMASLPDVVESQCSSASRSSKPALVWCGHSAHHSSVSASPGPRSAAQPQAVMCLIDSIPGLEVLATDEDIVRGLDAAQLEESFEISEQADFFDKDWTPFAHKGAVSLAG
jgi:hypothetical protein